MQRQRRTVEIMAAAGQTQESIAGALRIDEKTLRAHFADELQHGAARVRGELLCLLFEAASEGKVSAQTFLGEHLGIDRRAWSPRRREGSRQ